MDRLNNKSITIINSVLAALIPSLILLIVNSSIYYFNKEKVNISISESTYINDKYVTSISIKNFQEKDIIKEINLWLINGDISEINSNMKNSYIKDEKNIKINDIIPEYKGTMVVYSDIPLDRDNLKIETNIKSNIVFLGNQQESAYINIKNYAIICLIYFVMLSAFNIYSKLYTNKKIYEANEESKKVKEEQERIKADLEKAKESFENTNYKIEKVRIKYLKIIKDYNKELDFWKDTIRKLLYSSKEKTIKENDIFKEVTMNLKTFHTLDKCNYSDIYEILKDNDLNNKE